MNIIFILSILIILLSIPALLLYLCLYILSKYYMTCLTLEYCGFLKFKNINFYIDTDDFFISIHIDYFHIFFIWLKLRFNIKGVKSTLTLKTKSSSLIKTKPINMYDFADSFVIKKGDSYNKNYESLHKIKEKFNKILFEKYIKYFIVESEKENKIDDDNKEQKKEEDNNNKDTKYKFKKIIQKSEKPQLNVKDKMIRDLLSFFDIILDNIEFNFKLSESEFFYRIYFNKAIIYISKGLNINKEIQFLIILNNLNIKEYVNVSSIKFRKILSKRFNTIKAKKEEKLKKNKRKRNYYSLFDKYVEFNLLYSQEILVNLKLLNGFTSCNFNSLNNTIKINLEINNTRVDISSRAIDTIMKTLNELSKYQHFLEYKYNKDIQDIEIATDINDEKNFKILCSEEILLNMIKNEIKKIKIKLENTSINILSDNNIFLYSNISLSHLMVKNSNFFCLSCDESKIKLLKSKLELSLDNMVISSSKKIKKILNLNKYNLVINKEVIYYHTLKETYIKTLINSDLPSLSITINTNDLDKFIELIVNLICSIEKVEAYHNRSFFQTKYIEDVCEEINSNIYFNDVSMIVYDEIVHAELNYCSFVMKMNVIKNKSSKILLIFKPIYIDAFRRYCSKYTSNCIVKGFELSIDDDLKSAHINIDLDDVEILIYDDFMIDMIKFISEFITYNLRYSAKRKYKIQIQKEEFKAFPGKVEIVMLNVKSCTIYDYVAIKDLFTLTFENFNYVIDDYIKLPNLCIYHQNNSSIIKKKVKWLDLTRFYCKFFMNINQIDIEFGPILLDIYSFELIHPIITIFIYYNFFPFWVIYHMNYKFRIDEDYKLIYVVNFAKKEITSIKFEEVVVYINQNLIAPCSLFQANPEKLKMDNNKINNFQNDKCNSKLIIKQLKELKTQQIKIKVNGFTLNQKLFFEREVNKNFISDIEEESSDNENILGKDHSLIETKYNKIKELQDYLESNQNDLFELGKKITKIYQKPSPYYNKLSRISDLSMVFDKVNIYAEGIKILNLNNFKVNQKETKIYNKFDTNYLNSYSLSYKTHTIFYKEVKSHKIKETYAEIFCNDMKLSLIDVKIIDKISFFSICLNKVIMSYPFKENILEERLNENPMDKKDTVFLYVENLEAIVNSLDPKTGELYNKLYLRINYIALSNEKDKINNKTQLTIYYFSFGFNININNLNSKNKTRDYPLIILPLMEINIDRNVYRFNIPRNYAKKLNRNENELNVNLEENENNNKNIDLVNNYVGENKLDNFILNTQSFTIFINYHYLKVFSKIFENLWNRSEFVQQYLIHNIKNKDNNNQNNLNTIDYFESSKNIYFHGNTDYKRKKSRKQFFLESKPNNLFNKNNIEEKEEKKKEKEIVKVISSIFDLKIIYLINYQDKYYSTFAYHPQIRKHGYFGFIIRLYSAILKYSNYIDDIDNITHGKLETYNNLLTITSLNENNLNDEKWFIYDKDILDLNFKNFKDNKNFYSFMELPNSKINKYKALNNLLFNINHKKIFEFLDNDLPINNKFYQELPFNFNEVLIKMHEIQLKRDNLNNKELIETNICLDDIKVTWNKMNLDIISILVCEEILPIINAILKKLSKDENKNLNLNKNNKNNIISNDNLMNYKYKRNSHTNSFINKKEYKLEESESSLCFIVNNFQICIENEITSSKILISAKNDLIFKINKVFFSELEKSFIMELIVKNFVFYIPPENSEDKHIINWIGYSENNKYYLLQNEFNQIVILPNVFLQVKEIITNEIIKEKSNEESEINSNTNEEHEEAINIKSTSTVDIKIDKLNGEFKKEYFKSFMDIIQILIFNGGDSFAEEKMGIDAKEKDLKKYKLIEIKNKIKEQLNDKRNEVQKITKEIRFELREVSMTLIKEDKEFLKLLMKNLIGSQTQYEDSGNELVINIKDWKILDLQNPSNEILLSQQNNMNSQKIKNEIDNIGSKIIPYYENKIEMFRFRLKDNKISIGTLSKWYVIQYLEIGILPLYLNVTKNQCDFILEFFFNTNSSKGNLSYDEYKKDIEGKEDEKNEYKNMNKKNVNKENKPEEPFYFNNVKINNMKLNISFFFGHGSPFNFSKAKIKLYEFEKRDKFYSLTILISRFISHLKYMAITNLGNILSSFFFTSEEKHSELNEVSVKKKLKEEEDKHKKLLFGDLYNK